jgi:hypothetical protein
MPTTLTTTLLGLPIALHASDALSGRLRRECAALLTPELVPGSTSTQHLAIDDAGRLSGSGAVSPGTDPVQVALAELTGYAVTHSPKLCVHAGVVAAPGGTIAFPGASGHGKTTMTAALIQVGFGYLSDEVLALDRQTAAITPFPRPLAVDATSWALLGFDPETGPGPGEESLIPPHRLVHEPGAFESEDFRPTAPAVSDIVLARRSRNESGLDRVDRGQAVQALLAHSFNHYQDGRSSFQVAVRVVRSARVWRLSYRDAPTAARELAQYWL